MSGRVLQLHLFRATAPLCDIPSGCCFFTGPWTVTHSSLRMLRCEPARCPGCFTLHCGRAVILGSSHLSYIRGSSLAHHSFPQCTLGAPAVANWVLDPLGADEQQHCAAGALGLVPWVPDPLRALVVPQNASGARVVAHWVQGPLSVDKHRRHAVWAPRLAPRVPDPLRALVAPPNAPVVAHWVLGPLGTGRHRRCAAGATGLALCVPHPPRALTLSTPQGPCWPTGSPISRLTPLWGH